MLHTLMLISYSLSSLYMHEHGACSSLMKGALCYFRFTSSMTSSMPAVEEYVQHQHNFQDFATVGFMLFIPSKIFKPNFPFFFLLQHTKHILPDLFDTL